MGYYNQTLSYIKFKNPIDLNHAMQFYITYLDSAVFLAQYIMSFIYKFFPSHVYDDIVCFLVL